MTTTPLTHNKKYGGILLISALCFLVLVGAVQATNGAAPPTSPSTMAVYYKFNNNASIGETSVLAVDSAGHVNATIGTGAGFNSTFGILSGGGILFNGVNTSVNVSNNIAFNASSFTLSAWVMPNATYALAYRIIDRRTSNNGFILYQTGTSFACFVGNGTTNVISSASGKAAANNLSFVTCTYNGSLVSLYVNGILVDSDAFLGMTFSAQNLRIGNDASGNNFNGTMNEILFQNVSRTSSEVYTMYRDYVGCINLTNGVKSYIGENSTLCAGTYYYNDTTGEGFVNMTTANTEIDCNGAILVGNNSTNGVGISALGASNIKIANCTFNNWYYAVSGKNQIFVTRNNFTANYYGFYIGQSGGGHIISNNSFYNNTQSDVYISSGSTIGLQYTNNNCTRLTTVASSACFESTSGSANYPLTNFNITGNKFTMSGTAVYGVFLRKLGIGNISNNSFNGPGTISSYGLVVRQNNANLTIDGNNLLYSQYPLFVQDLNQNISFTNNVVTTTDEGLIVYNCLSCNILIQNNTFYNTTAHYDGYDAPIKIFNASGINIIRNNLSYFGSGAIQIQLGSSINITNNTFEGIPFSSRSLYLADDYREPYGAIKIVQLYKSYVGLGLESVFPGNIGNMSRLSSFNINISGNTFDANVQVPLTLQGAYNITHDLTNYWYTRLQYPTYLLNDTQFFTQNSFTNISRYSAGRSQVLSFGYNGVYTTNDTFTTEYSIHKNINTTGNFGIIIYNVTKTLAYGTNGTAFCTDINTCTGSIAYTITPGNTTYALYNYSVNQSASVRSYDPITVANSSSNVRTLTSTLTSNLTNVSVTLATGGIVPSSPLLVHPDGSSEYPSYSYDSVSETMTFNATIMSGTSTLRISPQNAQQQSICRNGTGALGELGGWLPIIALVIGAAIVIGILSGGFGIGIPTPEFNLNNLPSIALLIVFTVTTIAIASTVLTAIIC